MADQLCSALQLPPGELRLPATLLARTLHDTKLGAVGLALSDLRLSGLDGFGHISLLETQPHDGALLHHNLTLTLTLALTLTPILILTLPRLWVEGCRGSFLCNGTTVQCAYFGPRKHYCKC